MIKSVALIIWSSILRNVRAIEHMSQNLFGVLESLGHFNISAVQGCCQCVLALFSFQIDVGHQFLLARKDDLSFICEINLDDLIAQSEHDCVLCLHPLLNITVRSIRSTFFVELNFGIS